MLKETKTDVLDYLVKQLPKATAFINAKLEIVYVSDKWIEDFNFEDKAIIGTPIYELFDTIDDDKKALLERCLLGMPKQVVTESYVDETNREKWFEWTYTPWFDASENIIGLILQTDLVCEKVSLEQEVERLELLVKTKSEIAKIGSWEYDAINDSLGWCEMTRTIHEVPKSYIPSIEEAINFYKEGTSRTAISKIVKDAIKNGKPWSKRLQLVTAKGKEIWVVVSGKPRYTKGKFVGLIGTFQDVTTHIKSEIKTKESEHLLRTVIDNLPLNVFIKDLNNRKTLVNQSECNYLGVKSPEEVLGKTDFDFYDEATALISHEEDFRVIHQLKPILGKEYISIKKDGTTTSFLSSKIPLFNEEGGVTGIVGFSLDISHIKQKEEEMRNLINVTSLQNKKLINFAHIVSHNLRSHTANFSMLLEFLINEKDEAEKQNILNMLADASDNLLETLDNLNEVVAINTNTNLTKQPVRVTDKVIHVQQNLSAFLKKHNAEIINKIPVDLTINGIPAYVESILMNFITNAVKYQHPNRDPRIELNASQSEHQTTISISDNGLGIDLAKYGDKLFGMYKTFHEHSDARGIGLYITKNQIEAMNGKISTESEVNKGTTFNIYFNETD